MNLNSFAETRRVNGPIHTTFEIWTWNRRFLNFSRH